VVEAVEVAAVAVAAAEAAVPARNPPGTSFEMICRPNAR
jgi:hypothetical protein